MNKIIVLLIAISLAMFSVFAASGNIASFYGKSNPYNLTKTLDYYVRNYSQGIITGCNSHSVATCVTYNSCYNYTIGNITSSILISPDSTFNVSVPDYCKTDKMEFGTCNGALGNTLFYCWNGTAYHSFYGDSNPYIWYGSILVFGTKSVDYVAIPKNSFLSNLTINITGLSNPDATLTAFSGQTNPLSFLFSEPKSYYLSFPKDRNVKNITVGLAYKIPLNVSIVPNFYIFQNFGNQSAYSTALHEEWSHIENINDSDTTTYASKDSSTLGTAYYWENFTLLLNFNAVNLSAIYGCTGSFGTPIFTYNASIPSSCVFNTVQIRARSSIGATYDVYLDCYNGTDWYTITGDSRGNSQCGVIYEFWLYEGINNITISSKYMSVNLTNNTQFQYNSSTFSKNFSATSFSSCGIDNPLLSKGFQFNVTKDVYLIGAVLVANGAQNLTIYDASNNDTLEVADAANNVSYFPNPILLHKGKSYGIMAGNVFDGYYCDVNINVPNYLDDFINITYPVENFVPNLAITNHVYSIKGLIYAYENLSINVSLNESIINNILSLNCPVYTESNNCKANFTFYANTETNLTINLLNATYSDDYPKNLFSEMITEDSYAEINQSGNLSSKRQASLNVTLVNDILKNNCSCSLCYIQGNNCIFPIFTYSERLGTLNLAIANGSYAVIIDNCTNSMGISSNATTVNLSFYNLTSSITPISQVSFDYGLGNFSHSLTASNSLYCLYPGYANISTDISIHYSYGGSDYYYENTLTLNNITQNINLYVDSGTTPILLTVLDVQSKPVEGVIIKILKQDLSTGNFELYATLKSDSSGNAYANLILYTAYYRFILEYNGAVVLTQTSTLITSTQKYFYISDQTANWFSNAEIVEGVQTDIYYNNDTQNFVFNWNDVNNELHFACMQVTQSNNTKSTILSDSCVQSSAGTIIYNVPIAPENRYIAQGYFKFDSVIPAKTVEIFRHLEHGILAFGKMGTFIVFMLDICLVLIGLPNPVVSGIFLALGIIFSVSFNLWIMAVVNASSLVIMILINIYLGGRQQ